MASLLGLKANETDLVAGFAFILREGLSPFHSAGDHFRPLFTAYALLPIGLRQTPRLSE
jgi:hypothetical protein